MIDDFEAVMMKMEEIHNQLGSLRFCQVIENALDGIETDNFYLSDDGLLLALEIYLEREIG